MASVISKHIITKSNLCCLLNIAYDVEILRPAESLKMVNAALNPQKFADPCCSTIEEYITTYLSIRMMDRVGSWGTDLEISLAAQLLSTSIFVFKDVNLVGTNFPGIKDTMYMP